MGAHSSEDLQRIYKTRFAENLAYRRAVWSILANDWFSRYVGRNDKVLDLGCGYREFINAISCQKKYGMDLNPEARLHLDSSVEFLFQDCSKRWPLPDSSLDAVFTSNFFEHLPDKTALGLTLDEISRCLRPGGRLIAMGPNIKFLPGAYWDFWDHHIPLTEASVREALVSRSFDIDICLPKFLPYTMADGRQYPTIFLRAYLRLPLAWNFFGKQFLLVGTAR